MSKKKGGNPYGNEANTSNETKALTSEYDELQQMAGTRKRRNKRRSSFFAGKKWGRKTRKGRK